MKTDLSLTMCAAQAEGGGLVEAPARRPPFKVTVIVLANKMTCTGLALLVRGGV